jgi:uncharacterized SAM-binding protein YcdF (DUF218 family)
VTDFVWFFTSTGGAVTSLLAAALWVYARPQSGRARRFLLALALTYTAASVYGISYNAGRVLLLGFRPLERADVPRGPIAIVLLGAGGRTVRDWDGNRFSIVDPQAASRVRETIRVFNLLDADWIISSGGLVDPDDPDEPSGITMRDALVQEGVPASRILVETKSTNTHDEAVIVARMLESLDVDHVVLVTSGIHMRRSLGTFRKAGIEAIPAIAHRADGDVSWIEWLFPSDQGLAETSAVAHEIIGLGYYIARGWYQWGPPRAVTQTRPAAAAVPPASSARRRV